ncbi:hypothetical protein [Streptococcus sp. sy010]|uniref:hypothetical protein n=1 Tax=Streptococcus sp. sy010 TaxID=2600148 RepID=UPI0021BD0733|nr:hypothetical protein [Streptococcus sp. sy010]
MDEKGPQETFKITEPFDKMNKLSYGNDNMHSYVANVIQIDEENYVAITSDYNEIVRTYLLTRLQLQKSLEQKNKELKGLDLLKTNFDFGIASMKNNEVKFYTSLFKMLNKYNVNNLLFMISKMSIITSSRLTNFFYFLAEETKLSPFIVKYVLTKYVEIEASKKVIEALLNKSLPTRPLLRLIKEDLNRIIKNNQGNLRMAQQLETYQQLIVAIDRVITNHKIKLAEPKIPLSFDWNKVKWAFDLWMSEQKNLDKTIEWKLFLDEGIPKNIFKDLKIDNVEEKCDSKEHIGLQITNMIVVLIGKLVSRMREDTRYDFDKSDQRKLLTEKYFKLEKDHYNLFKELDKYIFSSHLNYDVINDSYFDETLLFQVYIKHIASFNTYEDYKQETPASHSEQHWKKFRHYATIKVNEYVKCEEHAQSLLGSVKNAVELGYLKPY